MKTYQSNRTCRRSLRRCCVSAQKQILAALLCIVCTVELYAQGTAFTYQGRLNDGANSAQGIYDLRFTIYDSASGGNAVTGVLTNAATVVSNGLFTVRLDFGPDASGFDGNVRWLEIGVRPNGSSDGFTILNPRHPITATPYAIRAANFSGAIADTQLSANIARLAASQTFSGTVQFANPANSFAGTFTGNGAGVTNVNLATINSGGAITANSKPTFTLSSSPRVGNGPSDVIAADVNGDGRVDLVSANFDDATLSVLTNNGAGLFTLVSSPSVGGYPLALAAADVNGDGRIDFISANYQQERLSVLTNNGSGGFTLASSPSAGLPAGSVAAADVNGDGHVDLISAHHSNGTLSVLANNGTGEFTLALWVGVGRGPSDITAADVNGDGRFDLISAHDYDHTLSVLINNGTGGFTLASSPAVPGNSVAAADVNGDKHIDLISGGGVLTNDGSGRFTLCSSLTVGAVTAADVNGDGRIDLISPNWDDTLSVLINDGIGGFTPASSPAVGHFPASVAAADVNGDGYIDLISANPQDNTLSVLLNLPFNFVGTFAGDGRGLTALPASNLTGIVPEWVLPWRIGALRMESISRPVITLCDSEESSVNVINGSDGNFVGTDVFGATIGGGGWSWSGLEVYVSEFSPPICGGQISIYRPNSVLADFGTISGGLDNTSGGYAATVGGGSGNTSSNAHATVPGGARNVAGGAYSFAAGNRANALHDGSFVWADSTDADIASTATNQFTIRATGGVRFVLGSDASGAELAPGSGAWSALSDRNAKENFAPANARDILDKVAALPLATWNYKSQDQSIRHIGPTAQDFHASFGVGENDRTITTVDADGVALAAIQGLNQKLEEKAARVDALEKELAALKELVVKLSTHRK